MNAFVVLDQINRLDHNNVVWDTTGVWMRSGNYTVFRDELQLLNGLGPSIWIADCRGPETDNGDTTAVKLARLIRRIDAWNDVSARRFACDCAERALSIYELKYRNSAPRNAIVVARRFANGDASVNDLAAATTDVLNATRTAIEFPANDAAWAAAWTVSNDMTSYAGRNAIRLAAEAIALHAAHAVTTHKTRYAPSDHYEYTKWHVAWYTAWTMERQWQADRLKEYL